MTLPTSVLMCFVWLEPKLYINALRCYSITTLYRQVAQLCNEKLIYIISIHSNLAKTIDLKQPSIPHWMVPYLIYENLTSDQHMINCKRNCSIVEEYSVTNGTANY